MGRLMLCARQKSTGEIVTAYLASKANAPFFCPECGDEVVLKAGATKINYFAHKNPLVCRYDANESTEHRQCKLEIYQALLRQPNVEKAAMERPLGTNRPDVNGRADYLLGGQRGPLCVLEAKGMRLVGSTRNVSRVCNEHFSWAEGGGKLHRLKLGVLAKMLNITSLDGFTDMFGPKWAYHLQPVIALIELPYYENMKLARMNGWDLRNDKGEPWPLLDLTPPADVVWKANFKAFVLAKEILLHRHRVRPDRNFKRFVPLKPQSEAERFKPPFKSWMDYTAGND